MPKHPTGKSERKTPIGQRKAGKGARSFTAPPAPTHAVPSKKGEPPTPREAGEQQFCLRRPATVEVATLLGKVEAITVPYAWDPHRKRILFSPRKETKGLS